MSRKLICIMILAGILATFFAVTPAMAAKPQPTATPAPSTVTPVASAIPTKEPNGNAPHKYLDDWCYINLDGTSGCYHVISMTRTGGSQQYIARYKGTWTFYGQNGVILKQTVWRLVYHFVYDPDGHLKMYRDLSMSNDGTYSFKYKGVYRHEDMNAHYWENGLKLY